MNVTLLHARYENSEHNDTYAFVGKRAYDAALLQALRLLAEYADGNWDEYDDRDVHKLRTRIEAGQYAEAVEQWNAMSTLQLVIEDTNSYSIKSVEKPGFKWSDDE
jgi:hypothetical protein